MRRMLLLLIPISLASCSGPEERSRTAPEESLADVSEPAPQGPSFSVSSAPGVAFQYRYAFDLPANKIEAVQEQHAAACEKLGLSRCRITGLRYHQVDERRVDAMIAFLLDPTIARQFGKSGVDAVNQAEGKLVDTEITGRDAGALIKSAGRNVAQLSDELRRIEEWLAQKGLPAAERERLQSQAAQLRQSIRANRDTQAEQEESLATTPMTFDYGVLEAGPALGDAVKDARNVFIGSITWLLIALITLLPWLVLLGLGWGGYRLVKPRLMPRRQEVAFASEAP